MDSSIAEKKRLEIQQKLEESSKQPRALYDYS